VLRAAPGDTLLAELVERGGEQRWLVVSAVMDELIGVNAYMALPQLHRLMREGPVVSGAQLSLARGEEAAVFERLRAIPGVAATASKTASVRSFEEQMAQGIRITISIVFALACVLAVGVIYNGARIALSERGRELAGLRVLGFSRAEVASMLLGEQAVITVAGLPLGMLLGLGTAALIATAYDTELYRMPLVFRADTAAIAAGVIALVGLAAGLLVRRKLDRADLIAVLKSRE
jgi:putative ABC transport system permease protein